MAWLTDAGIQTEVFSAEKAIVSDADGRLSASTVTASEIATLAGMSSAIQGQLDAINGAIEGRKWGVAVNVVAITNVTIATDTLIDDVIDGYTLVEGSRILLTAQTSPAENGIYEVQAIGAAIRSDETVSELANHAFLVTHGTAKGDTSWVCTNDSIEFGVTSIAFVQIDQGSIPDATTTTKGKASFSSTFFNVVAGAVSLIQTAITQLGTVTVGNVDAIVNSSSVGLGNVPNLKMNLVATAAPAATDDTSIGYSIGSIWYDTVAKKGYTCVDHTEDAAVWKEITAPEGTFDLSTHSVTDLSDVSDAGSGAIITTTERNKLNGIESSADVTDATNVAAAGAVMDGDFTANGLMRRTSTGGYTTIGIKTDATAAPTVNDDTTGGYSVGSIWINVTADIAYVCLDATGGAAVWLKISDINSLATHSVTELSDVSNAGSGAIITTDERSKLNGIEASADVTDASNVAAAGAVMDGDFTSNGVMTRTAAGTYAIMTKPSGALVGDTDIQNITNKKFGDGTNYSTFDANGQISFGGNGKPTQTIIQNAKGLDPSTTSGCATPTKVETTTNKVNYWVADFDAATDEYASFDIHMPDNWDAGTVTAKFVWTCTGGGAGGTVRWALQGQCFTNDDPIDATYGTAQEVDDDWIADGDEHITAATSAITIANAGAGRTVNFRVFRNADHANDDLTVDARLKRIIIEYSISQLST